MVSVVVRSSLLAWLALTASGCLLLAQPPAGATCEPERCPGGFGCESIGNQCVERCSSDRECKVGFVCDSSAGICEPVCEDSMCPGGYTCADFFNECESDCISDGDCKPGYYCCSFSDEDCEPYECVR